MRDLEKHRHLFLLLLILAAASFLRLKGLTFQSMWLDEIATLWHTSPGQSLSHIIHFCRDEDFNPPLFYIILWLWQKILGTAEFTARFLPAMSGLLGVIALYYLGRELFSETSGLYAASLAALLPFHLHYSQEVRSYSLMFLLCTLSYLFLIRLLKKQDLRNALLYTVITTAMIYTHYYGLLAVAAQVLFLAWHFLEGGKEKRGHSLKSVLPCLLFMVISYVPWIPTLARMKEQKSFWTPVPSQDFFVDYFFRYFNYEPYVILAAFVLIAFYLVGKSTENDFRGHKLLLLLLVLVLLLIPYCRSIGHKHPSPLYLRYTIIIVPALLLMMARGLEHLKPPRLQYAFLGAVLLMLCANIFFFSPGNYYRRVTKEQWRETAQFVIHQDPEGRYPVSAPVFSEYYFRDRFRHRMTLRPPVLTMKDAQDLYDEVSTGKIHGFWLYEAHSFADYDTHKFLDDRLCKMQMVSNTGARAILYLPRHAR